ncbi:hypothetical protein QIS99_30090 [Streptomyces sp. B-S-A8]|uniref:Lipoprotein n=1 Tax=Streptomyces solicavernae TaxID=3043614 RepID=A0ABT6S146_9ACTN|nr:hypothetical protein [Streptomyces sp. B-S-A8]MDI3390411.1 hypothetical protein [Streptomyces sp. B-S-A8]
MKMRLGFMVALLITTTTACSITNRSDTDEGSTSEMNLQEAADTADAILDDTFAAIDPPVEWTHNETMAGECSTERSRSVMTVISRDKQREFMTTVEKHWKAQGFKYRASSRDGEAVYYWTPDKFQVRLKFGWKNQAHFEVVTPCVKKTPVTHPTSRYDSLDYHGKERPAPNRHSDYWSSDKG